MNNQATFNKMLVLGKWTAFLAAIVLDWTGHLSQRQENLVETLIFSLMGVNIAAFMAGRVGNLGELVNRVFKLEQSAVAGDGQTPTVPPGAVSAVASILKPPSKG